MSQSFRDFEYAGWASADVCAHYHDYFSGLTTQSVGALLDGAAVHAGTQVLDVATGAGYVAGAALERGARVTATDFSAAQLRMARERHGGAVYQQCDAERLPFEAESFEAVVCNFGVPHFSNPDAFMQEAFRVLKRAGRLALTMWDVPQETKGFGALYAAIQAHGSMDVGLPPGPNFFLYSDLARCEEALVSAGFTACSVTRVPQMWRAPSVDTFLEAMLQGTVRAAGTLKRQTPEAREAVLEAIRNALSPYQRRDTFEVPMPAILAVATKD